MNSGASGFIGAPVSKALLLAASSSSFLLSHRNSGNILLSSARLFAFRHLGELAFGAVLLYYFRIFERHWGSERYGAFTLVTLGATQVTYTLLTALTPWNLQAGPYGLIAANLVSFAIDIPPVQSFTMLGVTMSDKVLIYAAAAQLALSAARHSWPSFLVGAAVGLAHQLNLLGFQKLKVPAAVSNLLGRTVGRLLGSVGQKHRIIRSAASSAVPGGAPGAPQVQANQQALQQLLAMGFDEGRASAALIQSDNDLQGALSRLL